MGRQTIQASTAMRHDLAIRNAVAVSVQTQRPAEIWRSDGPEGFVERKLGLVFVKPVVEGGGNCRTHVAENLAALGAFAPTSHQSRTRRTGFGCFGPLHLLAPLYGQKLQHEALMCLLVIPFANGTFYNFACPTEK